MARLHINLLGVPRIELDGASVESERNKAIAMLAYLAMSEGLHSRDSLAALLWPEYDQSRAFANLRRTLWELNNILGEGWIEADREAIGLAGERDIWLDVDQFESRADGCSQHAHAANQRCPECIQKLKEAAGLYKGDFLAGFNLRDSPEFDNWQFLQTESLRQKMASVLEGLVSCLLEADDAPSAIEYGLRWLGLDSLNEGAHRQMMLAYARMGKRGAALRQYQECVRVLAEELDVEPEPETTQLYEKIRDGLIDRMPVRREQLFVSAPAERSLHAPQMPTPFIGRDEDLAKIMLLLQDKQCRLLTLVGLGGIGKTRLAIEVGEQVYRRIEEGFKHGIYFVPLAPLLSPDSLVPAIADALNYIFQEEDTAGLPLDSQQNQLLDFLREKEILLILDNFEHLVAGAGLLSQIVAAARGVKLLVTSRERLNLREEWTYEVSGMDYPQEGSQVSLGDFSAVQLFLQNAERVSAGEWMPLEEMPHVARICQLLRGVPLALELASGWTKTLSPHEIANEIENSLDFLVTPLRGVDERHQSLRAVFDHSWKLLQAEEQAAFSKLSVFRGSFSREAAAQVSGASLPVFSSLIDKSLVRRASSGRYAMHELVKQYAAQKLIESGGEEQQARDRHAQYYAGQLLEVEKSLKGADQIEGLNRVERELEDIRTAWHWSVVRQDLDVFYSIGFVHFLFLTIRNRFQEADDETSKAMQQLRSSIAGTPTHALLEALAFTLAMRRSLLYALERQDEIDNVEHECLAIMRQTGLLDLTWDERKCFPYLLYVPVLIEFGAFVLDRSAVEVLYQKTLSGFERAGNPWGMALAKFNYSLVMHYRYADMNRMRMLLEECYQLFSSSRNPWGIALSLNGLANNAYTDGDYDAVIQYALESQEIYDETGDRWHMIDNYFKLGMASVAKGAYARAREYYEMGMTVIRELGSRFILSSLFDSIGYVDYLLGDYAAAEAAYQESLAISQSIGNGHTQAMALQNIGDVLRAKGNWQAAEEYYQHSIELLGEAVDSWEQALVWKKLGIVYRQTGDADRAKDCLIKALSLANKGSSLPETLNVLIEIAALVQAEGDLKQAIKILALCRNHPALAADANAKIEQMFGIIEAESPAVLSDAALQRAASGQLAEVVDELLSEKL